MTNPLVDHLERIQQGKHEGCQENIGSFRSFY